MSMFAVLRSLFRQKKYVLLVVLASFTNLLFFHNCSGGLQTESAPTNNPSPFKSPSTSRGGISLTPALISQMTQSSGGQVSIQKLTGTEQIPVGTKLGFVVDDACIKNRISGKLNRYFLDPYLNKNMALEPDAKFNQSLVEVNLTLPINFEQLTQIKRSDSCIVGIANDQGVKFKVSQFAAGSDIRPMQKYLTQTNYSADFFIQNTNEKSVKISVLDTGYDLLKGPRMNLIDSSLMVGSDYVGKDSDPQDTAGHGTAVASLIGAIPGSSRDFMGVAHKAAVIQPLRIIDPSTPIDGFQLFKYIKHAVNSGAEVINISLAGYYKSKDQQKISCDPLLGQSVFEAIDNNVFMVMAAGNSVCRTVDGVEVCEPIEVLSPKDNSTEGAFDQTIGPACWARYYKGALAVSSISDNGQISSFSNWGADSIEIAAPGDQVLVADLNSNFKYLSGTSFATPLVAGAVVNTMAYFKKRGWYYNPWIIEDTIINGSPTSSQLWGDTVTKKVRLGKVLDFKFLSDYLISLNSKTESERRMQPSDNPELGYGLNRSLASVIRQPIKLEVYTRQQFINVKTQSQIQAIVYYSDATTEVVSDRVKWISNAPDKLSILSSGMAYPSASGAYLVTAQDAQSGLTGSSTVNVVDFNTWTGSAGVLTSLKISNIKSDKINGDTFDVYAVYTDGRVRKIIDYTKVRYRQNQNGQIITGDQAQEPLMIGGATITDAILYRGFKVEHSTQLLKYKIVQAQVFNQLINEVTRDSFKIENTLTRNSNNYVGCTFQYEFEDPAAAFIYLKEGQNTTQFPTHEIATLSGGVVGNVANVLKINYKKSLNVLTNITDVSEIYLLNFWQKRMMNAFVPSTDAAGEVVYSCEIEHWGSGVLTKQAFNKTFTFADSKPLKITVTPYLDRNILQNGVLYPQTYFVNLRMDAYVWYENGSKRSLAQSGEYKVFSADGSVKPFNEVIKYSGSPQVTLALYNALKGETLKLEVKDPLTGLVAHLPIVVTGEIAQKIPALAQPTIEKISYPSSKPDSSYCESRKTLLPFAGGDGSVTNPFIICSAEQLASVNKITYEAVISGEIGDSRKTCLKQGSFRLAANINLSGLPATNLPIRLYAACQSKGVSHFLDGDGYAIKGYSAADAEARMMLFSVSMPPRQQLGLPDLDLFQIYNISRLLIEDISLRGKEAGLILGPNGSAPANLTNVHANRNYLEANFNYGLGSFTGSIINSSLRASTLASNPSNNTIVSGVSGAKLIQGSYIECQLNVTYGSNVFCVLADSVENSYVQVVGRAGIGAEVVGIQSVVTMGSKINTDINLPAGRFYAFRAIDFKGPYLVNVNPVQQGIYNSEFTGNVLLGSDSNGGVFATFYDLNRGFASGIKVRATVNARVISGVAQQLKYSTIKNMDIEINLNNVPLEASVARYAQVRQVDIQGYPAHYTVVENNKIVINGASNVPDLLSDTNGKRTDVIQTVIPAGW